MGLGFGVSLVGFGWFRAEFAGRNRWLKNLGPAIGRSQSLAQETWASDRPVAVAGPGIVAQRSAGGDR